MCYNIFTVRGNTPRKKEVTQMSAVEIKEILKGTFTDESDRQYWVKKLAEVERKEANAKENEKYFKKMRRYDR